LLDLRLQALVGGAQVGNGAVELVALDVAGATGKRDRRDGDGECGCTKGFAGHGRSPFLGAASASSGPRCQATSRGASASAIQDGEAYQSHSTCEGSVPDLSNEP